MMTGDQDPRAAARRRRLGIVAVATLAATVWAALQTDEPSPVRKSPRSELASATPREADRDARAAVAAGSALVWPDASRPDRQPWQDIVAQGKAAWEPPPPPPPVVPPAAAVAAVAAQEPQAPPFPYTLIGRIDDGVPRALLSGPLRSFGVKATDVIDGQWRVDAVQTRGVTLTWLPGQTKKNLVFSPS